MNLMDFHLDNLLNFPHVTVLSCQQQEEFIFLKLELLNQGILCPHCQTYTDNLHQTRSILVRDLSIFGQGVYLKVPRRQFICPHCSKYPTEELAWIDRGRNYTKRYEEYIYEKVVDSHKTEEIIEVLKKQPLKIRENVQEVSVDMWGGFPKVIRAVFPKALVVIDRFHVMKLVNKALNQLRLSLELKGLKSGCDRPVGFLRVARALSNRCLLLKNGRDLTEEENKELRELLQKSPCLSIAYELKEEFREIYETSTTVKMGRRRFKKWLTTAGCIFGSVTKTILKHLEEICNYFISGTSSGVIEGLNNKIKLILRQSYGFKNFDLMREKLLACLQ